MKLIGTRVNKVRIATVTRRILALFFTPVCAALVFWIAGTVAAADARVETESLVADPVPGYEMKVNNLTSGALEGLIVIPKVFRLGEDITVAPRPDPDKYGASEDPADTVPVIAAAEELLDGQELFWSPDTELMPGSSVRWYLDETILAVTWKQVVGGAVYCFSEVKIADASQFRRYLADDTFSSPVQYRTSEMANTVNAVVALSGDYYKFRPYGIIAYRRTLYRAEGQMLDSCLVDGNGDLNFVKHGALTSRQSMEKYIAENDILFSLAFGPVIVENGEKVIPSWYVTGEKDDALPRCVLSQLGELHYLLLTVNREAPYYQAPTLDTLADTLISMGVPKAYSLDGGQTGTLVMEGSPVNNVGYGNERSISDIIFFATAIPEERGEAG